MNNIVCQPILLFFQKFFLAVYISFLGMLYLYVFNKGGSLMFGQKVIFKPRIFFLISLAVFTCAFIVNSAINISSLPDRINVLEGEQFNLELAVGLRAEKEPVAEVAAVNSTPLSDVNEGWDVTVSLFGVPVRTLTVDVIRDMEVVPWGTAAGVRFQTDGVLVLGTGSVTSKDGTVERPSDGILKPGDILLEVNGISLENKEQLIETVEGAKPGEKINLKVKRENETFFKAIKPAVSRDDGKNKLGAWVRDGTQGIGTVTYFDPETKVFGALGHGITDVDTRRLMPVRTGVLMETSITNVRKAVKGSPGELIGETNASNIIGEITHNSRAGLFGNITSAAATLPTERMGIALQNSVREGPATIRAGVNGNEVRDFDIFIERVNRNSADESKGMVIRITDRDLIAATNGIVQGMSGSPIIQDGRLIGAVTHVFVQNPHRGYGIFIENMLRMAGR